MQELLLDWQILTSESFSRSAVRHSLRLIRNIYCSRANVAQKTNNSVPNILTFILSECIIVCIPCKITVPFENLNNHLWNRHKVPHNLRPAIIAGFDGLPAAQNIESLQPHKDGSASLPYLASPTPGFQCRRCEGFKTVNWDVIRQHAKKKHSITAPRCLQEKPEIECLLQQWTDHNPKYWTVLQSDQPQETFLENHQSSQST